LISEEPVRNSEEKPGGPCPERSRRAFRPRHLAAGIILLLGTLAAAGFLGRDRILNELARPWLEGFLAEKLSAEVGTGRMIFVSGGVAVENLSVIRPGGFRLVVDRVLVGLSVGGILERRLDELRLVSPVLSLGAGPGLPFTGLPERPDLTVQQLAVENGSLIFAAGDRSLRFRRIEGETSLASSFPFRISAVLGEGEELSLAVEGTGKWKDGLVLTLKQIAWGGRDLVVSPLTVSFLPAQGPLAGGVFRLEYFDSRQMDRVLEALQIPSPVPPGWEFAMVGPEAGFRLEEGRIAVDLTVPDCRVSRGSLVLPLTDLSLELSGQDSSWRSEGAFTLAGGTPGKVSFSRDPKETRAHLSLIVQDPGKLKRRLLGGSAPPLAGEVTLEAKLRQESGGLFLQADLRGRSGRKKPAAYLADLSPLAARLDVRQNGDQLSIKGRLFIAGRRILDVAGNSSRLYFDLRPLGWEEVKKVVGEALLPAAIGDAREIAGSGTVFRRPGGMWEGSGRFSAGKLSLGDTNIGEAVLAGRWSRSPRGLSVAGIEASARVAAGAIGAEVSAAGSLKLERETFRIHCDTLAVKNLDYLSPDGMSGLSGGRLKGFGEASGKIGSGKYRLKLFAELGASEVLRGPLYADISALPFRLELSGDLEPTRRRLSSADLSLMAEDIGILKFWGNLSAREGEVTGHLSVPNLGKAFTGRFRKILGESFPAWKTLEMEGSLTGKFTGSWEEGGAQLAGEIGAAGLGISWPRARVEIRGGIGTLPFDLVAGNGRKNTTATVERRGSVSFSSFVAGPASLASGEMRLAAGPDRFEILSPLIFDIGGGSLQVEDFAAHWSENGPGGRARVTLRNVDLEKLAGELGFPSMKGRVGANLGEIHYENGTLSTRGTAGMAVFDGDIVVRNMRYQDPFSSYPTFNADIDFSGLDLSLLTHSFAFGEMNGVVDGYVHNLRLFGLIPSEFDLMFETREEGKRNISVKALNNLSILSQGGISAALSRGIYRFIDFYRYRKIGFLCNLENDVFRIRGTALPGSDRYLVYGGWMPPKIDIIAPAHAISFKEMLKRLSRVERAGSRK
jgi:translocation and assembly module TamB